MALLHEDVLGLEVAVDDVVVVQVFDGQDDLGDVELGDVLLEVAADVQGLREVSLVAVVDYHVEVLFRLRV